jgi:hypothetical protein
LDIGNAFLADTPADILLKEFQEAFVERLLPIGFMYRLVKHWKFQDSDENRF